MKINYSLPVPPQNRLSSLLRLLFIPLLLSAVSIHAQAPVRQLTQKTEATANIILDGFLNEAVWADIPVRDGMRVILPDTLADASMETHVRIFYTERGIYLGSHNFQPPESIVSRMTSRDTALVRDGFVISIDPSGDGLYGHMIRINLGDSMTDATVLPERQFNMQWDGSWNGRTQRLDDGWSVEIFIPWSMMALPQAGETRQIGIYTERQVGHLAETWSSPALPRTVNEYLSAFDIYELRDIEPRRQITYYPFAATTYDSIKGESSYRVGVELFWRPTLNTQLSATLNPDFGNVESDDVVVNLGSFETFFPEKRSFFLEGQDIFNTSPRSTSRGRRGPLGPTSLLNTRRIGGAALYTVPDGVDVVPTDLSQPTDLLGAIKLTGQNGNLRYGTLLAAEDDSQIRGTLADGTRVAIQAQGRDFAIARLLYEDTSTGGRRSIGWMGTNISHPDIDAVTNAIDLHYFSADARWVADGQFMHSNVDGTTGAGFISDINYRPKRGVQHRLGLTYFDDELDLNDLGFLTRNDLIGIDYNYSVEQSDIEGLRSRTTSYMMVNQWNNNGRPVLTGLFANRGYTFLNNNDVSLGIRYFPSRVEDREDRGSGDYKIVSRWSASINWNTDLSRPFSYSLSLNANQGDLGKKRMGTGAGFSWRPVDRFNLGLDVNYTDREAWLIYQGDGHYTSFEATQWSPNLTMDYFITAKQQIRFNMQWTGIKASENKFWQSNPNKIDYLTEIPKPDSLSDDFIISRMTFQARYRWELAPLSDLFIVYTRGSNIPGNGFESYSQLFERAWNEKIVDTFVIKLRYRFGS